MKKSNLLNDYLNDFNGMIDSSLLKEIIDFKSKYSVLYIPEDMELYPVLMDYVGYLKNIKPELFELNAGLNLSFIDTMKWLDEKNLNYCPIGLTIETIKVFEEMDDIKTEMN